MAVDAILPANSREHGEAIHVHGPDSLQKVEQKDTGGQTTLRKEEPQKETDKSGKSNNVDLDDQDNYHRELLNILRRYDPGRLKEANALLQNYKGREWELIEHLQSLYRGEGTVFIAPSELPEDPRTLKKERKRSSLLQKKLGQLPKFNTKNMLKYTPKLPRRKSSSSGKKSNKPSQKMPGYGPEDFHISIANTDIAKSRSLDNNYSVDYNTQNSAVDVISPTRDRSDSRPRSLRGPVRGCRSGTRKRHTGSKSTKRYPTFTPDVKLPEIEQKHTIIVKDLNTGKNVDANDLNAEIQRGFQNLRLKQPSFKHQLIAFFEQYDPARVAEVDELLQHGGRTQEEIWKALQVDYKVDQRGRLTELFREHDPNMLQYADALLCEHVGQEENLIFMYEMKYSVKNAKKAMTQRSDSTWKPGQKNVYQLLPYNDLGD